MALARAKEPAERLYLYLPQSVKLKLEIMARIEYRSLNAEVTKALTEWSDALPDNDPEYLMRINELENAEEIV